MSSAQVRTETVDTIEVLHVDDESDFADLTATFLEREDDQFTVETATTADSGLDIIASRPPDCIVSDYNMPGMNGLEFLQAVRERYPDFPFILFTGKGSEAIASDAISAGVTDYLQKGSGTEQYELLANRVRNAVQARREAQRVDRQQHLTRLTEFAGDTGGWELDRESGTVLLTAGTRRIIGRPDRTELSLEEAIALFHPDDREEIQHTLNRAFETGEELHDTWRLQPGDGDTRLIDMTITPVVEAGGRVTKLRGAGHDITDREEQRQELETYETITEALTDAVYVLDEEGRFTYVSDEFVELVGYDRDRILGSMPSLIKDQDAVDRAENQLRRLLSSDGPETAQFEVTIQPRDGDPVVCEDHMGVLPYEGDHFEGSVGTLRDITDQKTRERELETINSQYETLVENFPDGAVYLIDTTLHCVRAGGQELSDVGLSPDDVEGTKPHDLFPEDIADELCHYYEEALDGTAHTFEQEYGGERYRVQTVPVRNDDEKIAYVMVAAQNVSGRVEDKRELERQNERLEEFASIVSHDLRNPLRVADGRVELIREECESDHIDDVAQALDRMDTLIEDVLTLAREGEQVDDIEPVGLANVTTTSWQTVNTEQATLETATTRDLTADRSRLRQLFENLYRNAVEHGGDDLTVSVGAMDDGFYVADTGPGIPESDREEIFEAGYSTTADGTGFGLRIVEQIARAHGWEIRAVDSETGGARFEILGVDTTS